MSVGAPNGGRLVGGVQLLRSRALSPREAGHSYALPELVRLLHRGAAKVAQRHRGSVLFVGDLSAREGGALEGHHSHQTGRDADVGFYVTNAAGRPLLTKRFVGFDGEGRARDGSGERFDDARNWAFVQALLTDRQAHVQYLFISLPLRARLLKYAERVRAPLGVVRRAAEVMMSPAHAESHDDHWHIRISCPPSMRGVCIEESQLRVARKGGSKGGKSPKPDVDPPGPGSHPGMSVSGEDDEPAEEAEPKAEAQAATDAPPAKSGGALPRKPESTPPVAKAPASAKAAPEPPTLAKAGKVDEASSGEAVADEDD
jgi:penicillin-insensitive murein endopeptidase